MSSDRFSSNVPLTIIPQRKHRKLLKDGSGTEVWPESIEQVFVQGLRDYWNSPYAVYSQSRGRSRWRNQYLVDYLHKQGIKRSKKQVASHIQVLRNMWKGAPEYHLVAGVDELYLESGSPAPVKMEDQWDTNSLIALDWDESSSNSISPDFSPADSQSEFPPTPEHRPNLYPAEVSALHAKPYLAPGTASPSISPRGEFMQQLPSYIDPSRYGFAKYPLTPTTFTPKSTDISQNIYLGATPTHHRQSRNRATAAFLSADGMSPFSINLNALAHSSAQIQPPFTLRIRLSVPTINDARTPSTLHGFLGGIALEHAWSASCRCITKVYENNLCVSVETGFLNITHINMGTVNATLPESPLSRCRWLDASRAIVLTQEIVVDEETLLMIIYDLDRKNGSMPSAALLGYQKFRASDKGTPVSSLSASPNVNHHTIPHAQPYGRHTGVSLSSGLSSTIRYPTTRPSTF
ncbi:hypothetical protein BYT27DRAFT_7203683 [Phlegmacium glaucopus]|nr:hypothetical protein BYT27DRAFT_7203683 [Phlegmacium glaucopus]